MATKETEYFAGELRFVTVRLFVVSGGLSVVGKGTKSFEKRTENNCC